MTKEMTYHLFFTYKLSKPFFLQITLVLVHKYVMYKMRFCTSCNLYKEPVQVATCTRSLYKLQLVQDWLYKLQLILDWLYKL